MRFNKSVIYDMKIFIPFFAFSVLIIIVMIAHNRVVKPIIISDIPIILSNKCITKVYPKDPGGMVISNQNKMIYDSIKSEKKKSNATKISHITTNDNEEDKLRLLQEIGVDKLSEIEYKGENLVTNNRVNSVFDVMKEDIVDNKLGLNSVRKNNKSINILKKR